VHLLTEPIIDTGWLQTMLRVLCDELQGWGRGRVHEMEREHLLHSVWRDFLGQNAIETDLTLDDLEHDTKARDGMTQVWSGNGAKKWDGVHPVMDGLWVRLPEAVSRTRKMKYFTFAD
jgi:hypothetical protein